jgi:hypothetical protein
MSDDRQTMRRALRPTVQMLAIPNGFTLTIGGVLAIAVGDRGYPGVLALWLYVVGGCVGFCLMSALAAAHTRLSDQAGPVSDRAVFNLVPVAVVPIVYAATHWIADDAGQFALAGFLAVTLYVAGYSIFAAWTRHR